MGIQSPSGTTNEIDFSETTGSLSVHVQSFSKELNPTPLRSAWGQEEKRSKYSSFGVILAFL